MNKKIKSYIVAVLIEFGHLGATNASGSSGGTTFSHNRSGNYARRRVIPVNPDTPAQAGVRNEFGNLSQGWRTLTQLERDAWNSATGQFPRKNALGKIIHLSGINLYKSLNQNLFDILASQITVPPSPTGATNINTLSFVADSAGPTMVTTFSPTPTATGNITLVYASPQVSPGINFLKNKMVIISRINAGVATGVDIQAAYIARYGALIVGQKIAIGFVAVNRLTGEKSPMITATTIVI